MASQTETMSMDIDAAGFPSTTSTKEDGTRSSTPVSSPTTPIVTPTTITTNTMAVTPTFNGQINDEVSFKEQGDSEGDPKETSTPLAQFTDTTLKTQDAAAEFLEEIGVHVVLPKLFDLDANELDLSSVPEHTMAKGKVEVLASCLVDAKYVNPILQLNSSLDRLHSEIEKARKKKRR